MATMRPELSEERLAALPSFAEAQFYRACRDQLADRVLVLHSVTAIRRGTRGAPRDAEADFVICDPERGVLVVEVKGGGVRYDPIAGQWESLDRHGRHHKIKDPFRQGTGAKYLILEQLQAAPRWTQAGIGRLTIGHTVVLPDVSDVRDLVGPQAPREILAGRRDLEQLAEWVGCALEFWAGKEPSSRPPGRSGVAALEEIFCRPVLVRPLMADLLCDEETIRVRLTEQQARLLRALGTRPRAAISGGAGTGKTLIAYQRARELASAGRTTLFVCYNRPLADFLKRQPGRPENLQPLSFHQLCDWRIALARQATGRDLFTEAETAFPGGDAFDVLRPFALALSAELPLGSYDAIIVDEGQDFKSEYWLPLELLLADAATSVFYVFYDPNQAIYARVREFPDLGEPFLLVSNCRNTRPIHEASYRYYRGAETEAPTLEGAPIDRLEGTSPAEQAAQLHRSIAHMVTTEGVAPKDITVLVLGRPKAAYYELLQRLTLPAKVTWAVEDHEMPGAVLVETGARFKGLEAPIVYLWGIDDLDVDRDRELLYVSLSRAKSRMILVGRPSSCTAILG